MAEPDPTHKTIDPDPAPVQKDEKKFTQFEVDEIVRKRLAREDKKPEPPPQEPATTPDPALAAAQSELQIALAQLEAVKEGVRPDCVEDAVYLAVRKAEKDGKPGDDGAIKEALSEVLKRHPEWKTAAAGEKQSGFRVGATGGEQPAESYQERYAAAKKEKNTALAIQIKREAAAKGVTLN